MSASTARKLPITPSEYLEGELASEVRHEYIDGKVYAMSGASAWHNQICGDIYSILKNHLRGGSCRTFIEAVKVELSDDLGNAFYYPDVFVTCEPVSDDTHVMREPKLIIEVISPTTGRNDRGEKLNAYKRIPSVEEIVLVEQDWPEIFVTRRSDRWKKHHFTQMESPVELQSVGLTLNVADFYQSNPFPEDVQRPFYLRFREDG
ncbi:MAG: Uma2 family endonuclease [Verrucomicrobia bacterium]|jgi:Uma2 family endonuclease|nr:Uma2 family endonuclease [Verrucomicrobiota bacterium]|tara:strand:- start:12940 stop:13554 length:615 start_codon:yes stop_codon:yes gene_type:complete